MKVVLAGAFGKLGSDILKELVKQGHEVIALDLIKKDIPEISGKYNAILEKLEEIDNVLNELSTGWKTSRMNRVDLTVLRLATYEIKWDEDVPTSVAINEAVELAKKYSSDSGPAFINGVLDKILKSL